MPMPYRCGRGGQHGVDAAMSHRVGSCLMQFFNRKTEQSTQAHQSAGDANNYGLSKSPAEALTLSFTVTLRSASMLMRSPTSSSHRPLPLNGDWILSSDRKSATTRACQMTIRMIVPRQIDAHQGDSTNHQCESSNNSTAYDRAIIKAGVTFPVSQQSKNTGLV